MRTRRLLLVVGVLATAMLGGGSAVEGAESVLTNDAPTWSPDGRRVAFTTFRHGRGEIYAMNVDGSGQRRLTRNPAHDDHAAWSPDGRRIAFTSFRSGNAEIYAMNGDGSRVTRLTRNPRHDYLPAWSPDGRRIVWTSYQDGDAELFAMDADGTDQRRLTDNTRADTSADWSSGGIAFVSTRDQATFNVYVMNEDGSNVRRVTTSALNHEQPDWSPDGTQLLYVSESQGTLGPADIFAVRADGTGTRRITESEGRDDWPAWSPDGRRMLFTRGLTFRTPEIFVANADGSRARRLTTTGPILEIVNADAAPLWPEAGRRWTTDILAVDARGAPLAGRMTPICRASIGGVALRTLIRRATTVGGVRCAWSVPLRARGLRVRGAIGLRMGKLRTELPFNLQVRSPSAP
jgi:dipeptidyl aminopeptidase/acylaminoacyl peptidase